MDTFEKKWEAAQMANWKHNKKEIVDLFWKFMIDASSLFDQITKLEYGRQQIIFYLLAKTKKILKICDFLDTLEKENGEDVDAIKIFFLVCHAEITMNNLGGRGSKAGLVEEFFRPVSASQKMPYKIRPELGSGKEGESFAWVLSAIRNEYAHTGNYTGHIFRHQETDPEISNIFHVEDRGKSVAIECQMSYEEFINCYMSALVKHIQSYGNLN